MEFKIPKQFSLMGQTIYVEFRDDLVHGADAHGTANYRENKIYIQKPTKSWNLPKDHLEHVFFHELAHWVLYTLKQDELYNNEPFVDMLGGLFYQAISTAKGELKY